MGSDSCAFLCVSQWWWEEVESEKTLGGEGEQHVTHFPGRCFLVSNPIMATNTQEPTHVNC